MKRIAAAASLVLVLMLLSYPSEASANEPFDLDAFTAAGLSMERVIEPRLDDVNFAAGANSYLPRSAARSIAGLPGALVWSLVKPA